MSGKKILAIICALLLIVMMAGCTSSAPSKSSTSSTTGQTSTGTESKTTETETKTTEPIIIKVACTQSINDPMAVNLQKFIAEVEEKTNGGIKCEFYPNGELGMLSDIQQMITREANVILQQGIDGMTEFVPELGVFGAPYIFESLDEVPILMASDWYKERIEKLAEGGIQALSFNWIAGTRNMISKKRIEKPDDLKGLIVRGPNTVIFTELIKSVGASHTISNWNEVYQGLSSGIFDVAEANVDLLYNSSLYEVCDYLSLTAHNTMCTGLITGTSFFRSLPEDYQKILIEASEKYGDEYSAQVRKTNEEAVEKFKEKGVEVIQVDLSLFAEKAQPVYKAVPGWHEGIYNEVRTIIEKGKNK